MSIRLMTDVWDLPTIGSATARLVLLALADQSNDDGVCWPFMATIASRADCGLSTARKACADLEASGLLRRELQKSADGDNDRSRYHLNVELIADMAGAARIERGAAKNERGGRQNLAGGAARNERHNPTTNPQVTKPSADASDGEEKPPAKEKPKTPPADPSKPLPVIEGLTLNQRANVLAGRQYERLGKMGNVPAFAKIVRKALDHGYADEAVDRVLAYIAEMNWTLTEQRLANQLRGGPRLPSSRPQQQTRAKARTTNGMEIQY